MTAKRTAGRLEITVENGETLLTVGERKIRCLDLFAAEQMHSELSRLGGAVALAREALKWTVRYLSDPSPQRDDEDDLEAAARRALAALEEVKP